jgi:hypothetical protein
MYLRKPHLAVLAPKKRVSQRLPAGTTPTHLYTGHTRKRYGNCDTGCEHTRSYRELAMKPLWTPTLAWIAAVAIAVLLAWAGPGGLGMDRWLFGGEISHGAAAPR